MRIVNVVSTCIKVADLPKDVPYVYVKNGKMYFFMRGAVKAVVFGTGKVKLFSSLYPPPNLPYFSKCKIDLLVIRAEIPVTSLEELLRQLEEKGFIMGDREKVNAVLAYRGETTVRIFPKTDSNTYKVMIFARSETDAEDTIRLLTAQ